MEREDTAERFIEILRPHVPICMTSKLGPFGFQGKHHQVRQKIDRETLTEMASRGVPIKRIARELGVGASTVDRRLREWGFIILGGRVDQEREEHGARSLLMQRWIDRYPLANLAGPDFNHREELRHIAAGETDALISGDEASGPDQGIWIEMSLEGSEVHFPDFRWKSGGWKTVLKKEGISFDDRGSVKVVRLADLVAWASPA